VFYFYLIYNGFVKGEIDRMAECMDEEIMLRITGYVKKLSKLKFMHFMDEEDIRQEFLCELIASAKNYDRSKGDFRRFANVVLRRKYFLILKKYHCAKRNVNITCEPRENHYTPDFFNEISESSDLKKTIMRLPSRYRDVLLMSLDHSVSEILEITGRYRSSVYADMKRAKKILQSVVSSDEQFFTYGLRGGYMKNLSILETLSAKEISRLEVMDLMDLNDQVAKLVSHTKELKEKLDDGLNLRFSEAVKNNLRSANKDTGTTRFFDGAFQIVAEIPKKVTWDNEKMEELIKRIPDERRKDIVKISYSIEERKYSALPHEYQELFREARTITPGKTKFQITLGANQCK
jgi:DNA-directed RNA polymerase specialized sigma24 family protein